MTMLKGLNPGRLRHKVTIMRYESEEDVLGNDHEVLKPIRTRWAEIRPIKINDKGNEFLEYHKIENATSYKVTMRYDPDITEKDVLKFRGRQLQILSVTNPLEDNYYLEMLCAEPKDHTVEEAEEDPVTPEDPEPQVEPEAPSNTETPEESGEETETG